MLPLNCVGPAEHKVGSERHLVPTHTLILIIKILKKQEKLTHSLSKSSAEFLSKKCNSVFIFIESVAI